MTRQIKTSWESSAHWYDEVVSDKGHYYHENVIFPHLLQLLDLKQTKNPKILDLACGQGILARKIPPNVSYVGVDISPSLIQAAKARSDNKQTQFFVQDLTQKMDLKTKDFTHATCVLALQNIEDPLTVLKNGASHLLAHGKLFLVLNHPCFRIPRQSHWGIDEAKKWQYRRIDRYLSPLKIPIQTHPGKTQKEETWSFHYPLSSFTHWLKESGFIITQMEEWISDKESTGSKARMENQARKEFPLFLTICAEKIR